MIGRNEEYNRNALLSKINRINVEVAYLDYKRVVWGRIYRMIGKNAQLCYGDPFVEVDGLRNDRGFPDKIRQDKDFALAALPIYPVIYEFLSPKLKTDRDILMALAKSPIYYNDEKEGRVSHAISPLSLIIEEHKRRSKYIRTNRDGSKEVLTGEGLPFVKEEENESLKINDEELVIEALKAELDSFSHCIQMEGENRSDTPYKGALVLEELRKGKNVNPDLFMYLLTLQLTSKEILENANSKNEIIQIITHWAEHNRNLDQALSTDLDWLTQ